MKNKFFITVVAVSFLLTSFVSIVQAAQKRTGKAPTAQPTPAVTTQPTPAVTDLKQAIIDKAHSTLSSHEWTIYVIPADGKGAVETDVLTFSNGKVTSRNLSAQGYPTSNYGVFIQDDGSITWETMQAKEVVKEKEIDLAFLRGGLSSDATEMAGTISVRPQKAPRHNFIYSTKASDVENIPAAVTATTTKTTKKKGAR